MSQIQELDRSKVGRELAERMSVVQDRRLAEPLLPPQVVEKAGGPGLEGVLGLSAASHPGIARNGETQHLLNRVANTFSDFFALCSRLPPAHPLFQPGADEGLNIGWQVFPFLGALLPGELSKTHDNGKTTRNTPKR